MSNRLYFRIFVGIVLTASVIILITISEEELDFFVFYELPRPLDYLASVKDGLKGAHPSTCKCYQSWRVQDWRVAFMNTSLPWLNITTYEEVKHRHPNLPLEFLYGANKMRCSLLPTISSIEWINRYWQRATLDSNESFFLYSAFLDPETDGKASVRLLGVSRSKSPAPAWCQIWFKSDAPPIPVRVTHVDYLDYQGRNHKRQMPYLLRCPLPPHTNPAVPLAVSLTSQPCAPPTNLLKVIGAMKREVSAYRSKKVPHNPTTLVKGWSAAVCGPALFYYHEDFSSRLVEWLEVMRAQGFSRVFLYATDVHPNISKVLRHYTKEGFVQVTDYSYPPPYVNEPNLRRLWVLVEREKMFAQENVYFSDCVLRHMHQYRFLTHFDPDEVPILPHHHNFTHFLDDLVAGIKGAAPPGFKLQWNFFYDNIGPSEEAADLPSSLWVLRHTHRRGEHTKRPYPGRYKPIFDMNAVRGVFSHGSLLCISGRCGPGSLKAVSPETQAFLGHFKYKCDEKCNKSLVSDLTLLKYKEQVTTRALKVMSSLNLV